MAANQEELHQPLNLLLVPPQLGHHEPQLVLIITGQVRVLDLSSSPWRRTSPSLWSRLLPMSLPGTYLVLVILSVNSLRPSHHPGSRCWPHRRWKRCCTWTRSPRPRKTSFSVTRRRNSCSVSCIFSVSNWIFNEVYHISIPLYPHPLLIQFWKSWHVYRDHS